MNTSARIYRLAIEYAAEAKDVGELTKAFLWSLRKKLKPSGWHIQGKMGSPDIAKYGGRNAELCTYIGPYVLHMPFTVFISPDMQSGELRIGRGRERRGPALDFGFRDIPHPPQYGAYRDAYGPVAIREAIHGYERLHVPLGTIIPFESPAPSEETALEFLRWFDIRHPHWEKAAWQLMEKAGVPRLD